MKTIWFDAQQETPKGSQLCVVIGETKTNPSIFPYVAIYDDHSHEFQSLGPDKTYMPKSNAKWWTPIDMPSGPHSIDA
ncbi:MAG: hypothetical protein ACXWFI_07445 [Methylobacter sp.]